jgi:hypothetical protein
MVAARRSAPWPPWRERRRAVLAVLAAASALASAALWVRAEARPELGGLARAAALLAWFALVMLLVRLPPRARAPREGGAAVLRASLARRLALPLAIGPALGLVALRMLADERGAAGRWAAAFTALVVAGLTLAALRGTRALRLLPEGIEPRGRDGAVLRWERIRAVRIETYRRHAGLVLLGMDGSPSVGVSVWLDGTPELAAELLARAPAEALADPEARSALEALAAEARRSG